MRKARKSSTGAASTDKTPEAGGATCGSTSLASSEPGQGRILAILAVLLASRVALTLIGVLSRVLIGRQTNVGGFAEELVRADAEHGLRLGIRGVRDTRWYLKIADNWYAAEALADGTGQASHAFFPLHPLLMRIAWFPFGSSFSRTAVLFGAALLWSTAVQSVGAWSYSQVGWLKRWEEHDDPDKAGLWRWTRPQIGCHVANFDSQRALKHAVMRDYVGKAGPILYLSAPE